MTHSGTQLGLVTAAQFLPMLVLGPWGGLIVDRFPKRKILYFTQSISAVLALTLAVLVATDTVQLWMVYVLSFFLGLTNAVDNPARQTFVTELVGDDRLANAVSLNAIQINLSRVVGPALAGTLIATVGIAPLFFINAFSFVAVLFALRAMNGAEFSPTKIITRASGQLAEGFRYVAKHPVLYNTLIMMAIIGTLTYEFTVSLPLLAEFTFHGSAGTYAVLMASMGIGSMIGGVYTASKKRPTRKSIVVSAFFFGVTTLIASAMPTLILEIIAIAFVGFSSIIFLAYSNIILQLESVPEMRGRVMALLAVAFLGSTPIGGPIIGWIAEHAGPRYGLVVGGIAALVAASIGYRSLRRA
jgi:MFS family permease